jgi:hypothetical protein
MDHVVTTPPARRVPPTRRARLWLVLAAALIAVVALVDVTISGPRVSVRWRADTSPADRAALERRYDLRNGERDEDSVFTWRYELGDRSRANTGALLSDPAVDDTHYIDRDSLTASASDIRVTMRPLPPLPGLPFPFNTTDEFMDPRQLFQIQSGWLFLAGGVILWAARASARRHRRNVTVAMLALVGVLACAFPLSPSLVRMSDAGQHVDSRTAFEDYAGVRQIRFEAHLSYAILGRLDRLFGQTDEAPRRAQITLTRVATAWFVLSAFAIGFLEGWSQVVLRYVALTLLAPSALLYFGWREFGYLSLNVAAFPLIARGVRDGGNRLEVGSVLSGLGAALHGWGLVALAGAWMAALVTPATLATRVGRALRVAAWGTAAYAGWFAVYIIVLKLPITLGHAEAIPWRPLFVDEGFDGRLNVAIFSATGGRDLAMTAWIVGAPLLVVAASLWRQHGDEVRTALGYALPSVILTILVWHTQGLREDMDVVVAIFPAFYALAWVCARDLTRTNVAAALLVSAHLAFWRALLDAQFAVIAVD